MPFHQSLHSFSSKSLHVGKLCMGVLWSKSFYNKKCCRHYYWCPPKCLSAVGAGVSLLLAQMSAAEGQSPCATKSTEVRCLKEMYRSCPVLFSFFHFYLSHILYSPFCSCFPFNFWWCSSHLLNTSHLYATSDVILGLQSSCPAIFTSLKINFPHHLSKTLLITIVFSICWSLQN